MTLHYKKERSKVFLVSYNRNDYEKVLEGFPEQTYNIPSSITDIDENALKGVDDVTLKYDGEASGRPFGATNVKDVSPTLDAISIGYHGDEYQYLYSTGYYNSYGSTMTELNFPKLQKWNIKSDFQQSYPAVTSLSFPELRTLENEGKDRNLTIDLVTEITDESFPVLETLGSRVFWQNDKITKVDLSSVTSVGDHCFYDCYGLTDFNMPNVKSIGAECFNYCNKLKTISMPLVEHIGWDCFASCRNVLEFDFPNLTDAESSCFNSCSGAITFNLPKITRAGSLFFLSCENATTINVPNLTSAGTSCFLGCTSMSEFDLPLLEGADETCFARCTNVTSFNLPSLLQAGSNCFMNCTGITELNLPLLTHAGEDCFNNCSNVETFTLPKLLYAGTKCFENCSSVIDLKLPSMFIMGSECFTGCTKLKKLRIEGLESINSDGIFSNIGSPELSVDLDGVTQWTSDTEFGVDKLNLWISNKIETLEGQVTEFPEYVTIWTDCANSSEGAILEAKKGNATIVYGKTHTQFVRRFFDEIIDPTEAVSIGYEGDDFQHILEREEYEVVGQTIEELNYPYLEKWNIKSDEKQVYPSVTTLNFPVLRTLENEVANDDPDNYEQNITFEQISEITSESFPVLETVGDYAFCNWYLGIVDLPTLTSIGKACFANTDVGRVNIPNVSEIPDYSFYNCGHLSELNAGFPNVTTLGNHCFEKCSELRTVDFSNVTTAGDGCFNYCTFVSSFNLPRLKTAGIDCFYNCNYYKSTFNLPELVSAGDGCFGNCYSTEGFDFPLLEMAGDYCFQYCEGATTFNLPALTTAGDGCFDNCKNVSYFDLPSLRFAGSDCFKECTHVPSFNLPLLETAGDRCFYDCTAIEELNLPSLTTMGAQCFGIDKSNLKVLQLPSLKTISTNMFMDFNPRLTIAIDLDGLTNWDNNANFTPTNNVNMWISKKLLSMIPQEPELPSNVTIWTDFANAEEGAVLEENKGSAVIMWGKTHSEFVEACINGQNENVNATSIGYPEDEYQYLMSDSYYEAHRDQALELTYPNLQKWNIKDTTQTYPCVTKFNAPKLTTIDSEIADSSDDSRPFGGLIELNGNNLPVVERVGNYVFMNNLSLTSMKLPKLKYAGNKCFYNCYNVTSMNFPLLNEVGDGCFRECYNLETIDLTNITELGNEVFCGCQKLNTVNIPQLTTAGNGCFQGCLKLQTLNFPLLIAAGEYCFDGCETSQNIDLPSLINAGNWCFGNCDNITEINLPSLTTIGDGCFNNCTSLTKIRIPKVSSINSSLTFHNIGSQELAIDLDGLTTSNLLSFSADISEVNVWISKKLTSMKLSDLPSNVTIYTDFTDPVDGAVLEADKDEATIVYGRTHEWFIRTFFEGKDENVLSCTENSYSSTSSNTHVKVMLAKFPEDWRNRQCQTLKLFGDFTGSTCLVTQRLTWRTPSGGNNSVGLDTTSVPVVGNSITLDMTQLGFSVDYTKPNDSYLDITFTGASRVYYLSNAVSSEEGYGVVADATSETGSPIKAVAYELTFAPLVIPDGYAVLDNEIAETYFYNRISGLPTDFDEFIKQQTNYTSYYVAAAEFDTTFGYGTTAYICLAYSQTEDKFIMRVRDSSNSSTTMYGPISWSNGSQATVRVGNVDFYVSGKRTSDKNNFYFSYKQCVLYNTPIQLADGSTKLANEVQVGDKLMGHVNGEFKEAEVLKVFKTVSNSWIKLTTENHQLELSDDHPVLTDNGWAIYNTDKSNSSLNVVQLDTSLKVLTNDGNYEQIVSIEPCESVEPVEMFSYNVDNDVDTFVAGGLVTHNAKEVVSPPS